MIIGLVPGAATFNTPPDLRPGERTALAATMPTTVLADMRRNLPKLAEAMDQTVAAG